MQKSKLAKEAGIVAALIVAIVVAYVLFSSPGLEVVADGTYEATLMQLRLTNQTQPDTIQESGVLTQFAYETYDFSSLLIPGTPFIAYPAAAVRLLTQPFGLDFHTWMLALVYIVILALSAYLLVSGLYMHTRIGAIVAAAGMTILFMQSNITGYLNSLYDLGAVITAFSLYVGCLVHALCMPRGSGSRHAVGVILSGMFLLCAQAQLVVLLPFILVGMLLVVAHGMPKGPRWSIHVTICAAMLVLCIQSTCTMYADSEDVHSDAANYLAVFQGYLTPSPDPEADLAEFGLDATYATDIGHSYYEDPENFVHDPYSEAEQTALFEKITSKDRIAFCLAHPQRIAQRIVQLEAHLYSPSNDRILTLDGQANAERLSPYLLLDLILIQKGFGAQTVRMFVAAVLCLILALLHKRSGVHKLLISLSSLMLGMICYLPVCVALTGGVDIDRIKIVFMFFSWAAFFVACAVGACLVQRVCAWFSESHAKLRQDAPALTVCAKAAPLGSGISRIQITRNRLLWGSAIACVAIAAMLLLPQNHVGGVNNGDYGRMMDQLDLFWTQEFLDHSDLQAETVVIENYTYLRPFNPQKLTLANPTYSLIFPAALVRAYSTVTGADFSTLLLAWILVAFTIASILLIIHDLYPLLGRATLLLAAGLIAMLLGENYIAWYNALFGESSISTGLVMMIACAVHLCTIPRGAKRSVIWLLLLGMSVYFLVCAKAQFLLALPMGLVLIVGLAWYHRPKRTVPSLALGLAMLLMIGATGWGAYGVYKKNDAVSARQNTWQSMFFGILMIADDPVAVLEELGIDTALEADISKHSYYLEEDYVYPFNSKEMDEAFFDHVNRFTMVKYYLSHPKDFLTMLDYIAQESVHLHVGFMGYSEEIYHDSDGLYRFNLWRNIRPLTAGRAFWQYVLAYGALSIYLIRALFRKKTPARNKMFALLLLCVMLIGVVQYPLSVVGNGFADNNKQLYGFMLCHDMLVITMITLGIRGLYRHVWKKEADQLATAQESEVEA